MNNKFLLSVIFIFSLFSTAFPISKIYSAKPIPTKKTADGIQYIKKGHQYKDSGGLFLVVEEDPNDKSLKLSCPYFGTDDSLYIHFIPGNLFSIRISSEVEWIDSLGLYQYDYVLSSDPESFRPIHHIEIEWLNYYKEVKISVGWMSSKIPYPPRKVYTWSAFSVGDDLLPGDSLNGIGFRSSAPPTIASFSVWGRTEELGMKFPIDNSHANNVLWEAYSEIESQQRQVNGYTIIPGICPEVIDPVEWLFRIDVGLNKLKQCGYLKEDSKKTMHGLIMQKNSMFKSKESHDLEILDVEIKNLIAEIKQNEETLEPEARVFLLENLNYMLRNINIIQFKEYPH